MQQWQCAGDEIGGTGKLWSEHNMFLAYLEIFPIIFILGEGGCFPRKSFLNHMQNNKDGLNMRYLVNMAIVPEEAICLETETTFWSSINCKYLYK
jgi:hypothetical protein